MSIAWKTLGHGFYAATENPPGSIRFYLVVEYGGCCRWSVFWPGEAVTEIRNGSAPTVQEAMHHAERAAAKDTELE